MTGKPATAALPGAPAGRSRIATVAAMMTGAQVGVQFTITRALGDDLAPGTLAFLRYGLAVAILAPFVLASFRQTFRRQDILPIACLGILMFGVMIALQNLALRYTPAGRGALLFSTMPFFTMMVGAWLGLERMTRWKTTGIALTTCGVGLVLGQGVLESGAGNTYWLGEGLMIACALIAGSCSVLYRPFVNRYGALPVGALSMLFAAGPLFVVSLLEGGLAALPGLSMAAWAGVIALGGTSALFYWMWLWALGRLSPTHVNVFQALGPISAAIAAAVFLGEAIQPTFVIGVAVVTVGFVIAHRR